MTLCGGLSREESNELYASVLRDHDEATLRRLCREDLFFLATVACLRRDMDQDWLYARCREVEADPNGRLDLWAREHYKSTIITFLLSIQDILSSHGINPHPKWGGRETTNGIFSHTKGIAKAFLAQIKEELEGNTFLKKLFPDILFDNPQREAPRWSLDNGICVKRKSNPKEQTVEASGLVDGMPTGKHYLILTYDDVVTMDSVTTPEQITKTTTSWEMSLNLGSDGGYHRYIGTRYHYNDTYRTMMDRGVVTPRIYPATHDGTMDGEPVFLSVESLAAKRRAFGPYVFGSQMLQDPVADKAMGFRQEWLRRYDQMGDTHLWNKYILVDPAGEKKKSNDFTVIMCIGLAPDNRYYVLDAIRDRLNLTERTRALFKMVREHKPAKVGYEKYGLQADIEHIRYVMEQENYRFEILPLGGQMPKNDRIRRLVPIFEQGRFYIPHRLLFVDQEGKTRDFIHEFLNDEYLSFPVSSHDDMLDCAARILDTDLAAVFPTEQEFDINATEPWANKGQMDVSGYDVLAL